MDSIKDKQLFNLLKNQLGLIGNSPAMEDALHLLNQAAPTDLSVLITGETGTGKEVFAHAVHKMSLRKKYPFVSVNCGAIPETLLEAELFGNEKGAYTGAVEQRKGFFETAHKGTIFLDEIGEMPVNTQVKLLRILESGEFSRLGSSAVHKVDVRVVAATNRDLENEISEGKFRQDLYFRLKSVHIKIPPLRNRTDDIPLLVDYFAEHTAEKLDLEYRGISPDSMQILMGLPWYGNVRELKNLVETIITLEHKSYITPDILRRYISPALPPANIVETPTDKALVPIGNVKRSNNFESELIFRSLLEIQSEVANLGRGLHALSLKIDKIDSSIDDMKDGDFRKYDDFNTDAKDDSLEIMPLVEMEKIMIKRALAKTNNNRRQAAILLGISERTLYRKLIEFEIE